MPKAKKKVSKKVEKEAEKKKQSPSDAVASSDAKDVPMSADALANLNAIFENKVYFSIAREHSSNGRGWCVDVLGLSQEKGELIRERVIADASYGLARAKLKRLMKVLTFAALRAQEVNVDDLA